MTNPSSLTKKGVCRRSLLTCVPAIAGAIISTNAMAGSLFAQTKLTHEAAKYQDNPKRRAAMLRLRPVRSPCFMQGGGRSRRCERMVPTLCRQARPKDRP